MSPKVTVEHEKQQRERILRAATACFCRRGYHETTIQDICDEAGLSKGGLYTYFPSKEEILSAAVEASFVGSIAEAMAAAREGRSALEKLERIGAAAVARLTGPEPDPTQSPLLLMEIWAEASKTPALHARCAAGYARWKQFLAEVLREGIAAGELRRELDPHALAAIFVAFFDGLMLQESLTGAKVDWGQVITTLRQALVYGILADGPRAEGRP